MADQRVHQMCRQGQIEALKIALNQGIVLDGHDDDGMTLLSSSILHQHHQCVDLLLEAGVDVNAEGSTSPGGSPLHWALSVGDANSVLKLIRFGADVNREDDEGVTPVMIAAHQGRMDCLKILVETGALLGCPDIHGDTPLHAAANEGRKDCLIFLLQHGADPSAVNMRGKKPEDVVETEELGVILRSWREKQELEGSPFSDFPGRSPPRL